MQSEFKYKFKILPINDPYMGYTHILRILVFTKKDKLLTLAETSCIDLNFLAREKVIFQTLRDLRSSLKQSVRSLENIYKEDK